MSSYQKPTAVLGQFAARFLEDLETVQEDTDTRIMLTDMVIIAAYDSYDIETGEVANRGTVIMRRNGYPHAIRGLCLAAVDLCSSTMKRMF